MRTSWIFVFAVTVASWPVAGAAPDGLAGSALESSAEPRPWPDEELAGGATTAFDHRVSAFGHSVRTVRSSQRLSARVGRRLFESPWSPPGQATARGSQQGLGPLFNAVACTDCHFRDGRGAPPTEELGPVAPGLSTMPPLEPSPAPRLARLRLPSGAPDPRYGGQLNDRGVGVTGEGTLSVLEVPAVLQTSDGRRHTLRRLEPTLSALARGPLHADSRVALRIPPTLIGLGLLEAVPTSVLEALADPDDRDGDGISGRLRRLPPARRSQGQGGPPAPPDIIGRFGWKASQPDLPSQITAALADDMGVTSSYHPRPNCPAGDAACLRLAGDAVELDALQLERLALYLRLLAPPSRRDWQDETVLRGRDLFVAIGCADCHVPSLRTATRAERPDILPELAGHTIRPYTDLLLHDLGPDLADPAPEPGVAAGEWRTAPLWGLGLIETVNGHLELLHDGRARTMTEAILWHGGEAEGSRNRFSALAPRDREALLRFLESL